MIKKINILFFKYNKLFAISIPAFLAIMLTISVRYYFFFILHIDLLKVYDYPYICIIVLFNIYLIKFYVKFILQSVFNSKLNKLNSNGFNKFFTDNNKVN